MGDQQAGGVPGHVRVTSTISRLLPIHLQRSFRDGGGTRALFDAASYASAGILGMTVPGLMERFLTVTGRVTKHRYGPHPSQVLEIVPRHVKGTAVKLVPERVTLFMHGGAWGSGKPMLYRVLAESLSLQGHAVIILGYRTYPDGTADDQIDDLSFALAWLREHGPEHGLPLRLPFYLSGHSSGAHIVLMYLLRRAMAPGKYNGHPAVKGFIGLSGVYDIRKHYHYEAWRGVHEISSMKAACGGRFRGFFEYSPTAILATRFSRSIAMSLPPALIVHGTGDETVPFTSSSELAAQLISHGVPTVTWYLHKKDHFASIAEIMLESDGGGEVHDGLRRFLASVERHALVSKM